MNETLDLPDIISADDLFDGAPAEVPGELRTPAGVLKQVASGAAVTVAAPAAVTEDKPKTLSVKETVLALFRETEPGLRALAERYRDVVYDAKTSRGLKDMKAARHDLRENGRFAVQRAEERVKKELNGAKAVVTEEAARLIAITKATEDGYDNQIAAREAEIEAEKAEVARIEALAIAENAARCAKLTGTIDIAQGKTSAQIGNAIAHIEALAITLEKWGNRADFMAAGEKAKADTLTALRKLQAETKTAEDNAALRAENERLAAELAESRRVEAEAAAARQRAENEAAAALVREAQRQAEEDARATAQAAEAERLQKEAAAAAMQRAADATPEVVIAEAYAPAVVILAAVSTGVLHPTPEPAQQATAPVDAVSALLAHLREELEGKFASHPKPTTAWWTRTRQLVAEVQS